MSALTSAGSLLLGKASGIYASISSTQTLGTKSRNQSGLGNDQDVYNSRGELTFNQVEGAFAVDSPFHEMKLGGSSSPGGKLLHDEDVGDKTEYTKESAEESDQCDIASCLLDSGVIEDVVREYKSLPTHHNSTKTTDFSCWEVFYYLNHPTDL